MVARVSKDEQLRHVVEGVALGVLAQGVSAISSQKLEFELGFERAWHSWSRATYFPSITGNEVGQLFWIGVGKSERRRGVRAAWRRGQWCEPYITLDDWTVEECLGIHADERATADDWVGLGRSYVTTFKPERIRRGTDLNV